MTSEHPIIQILRDNGYKLNDKGSNYSCAAKFRGGVRETSLSIEKTTGKWFDFVEARGGGPDQLIELITGGSIKFGKVEVKEEKFKVTKKCNSDILEALLPDYGFFIEKRGISKETMQLFQSGLCLSGPLRKRIVFPVFERGNPNNIIGFNARWFQEQTPHKDVPKWKKLGHSKDFLWGSEYNEKLCREKGIVIITESIGDSLRLVEAGLPYFLCIHGLKISPKQINYLLGLNPHTIFVSVNRDDDSKKGEGAAKEIRKKLENFFDTSKIHIKLPPAPYNDLMEMPNQLVKKLYE